MSLHAELRTVIDARIAAKEIGEESSINLHQVIVSSSAAARSVQAHDYAKALKKRDIASASFDVSLTTIDSSDGYTKVARHLSQLFMENSVVIIDRIYDVPADIMPLIVSFITEAIDHHKISCLVLTGEAKEMVVFMSNQQELSKRIPKGMILAQDKAPPSGRPPYRMPGITKF